MNEHDVREILSDEKKDCEKLFMSHRSFIKYILIALGPMLVLGVGAIAYGSRVGSEAAVNTKVNATQERRIEVVEDGQASMLKNQETMIQNQKNLLAKVGR